MYKLDAEGKLADKGNSRSQVWARRRKEGLVQGIVAIKEGAVERFHKEILTKYDSHASFDTKDLYKVRHSHCGKWLTMEVVNHVKAFKDHVASCGVSTIVSKRNGAGSFTLKAAWAHSSARSHTNTIVFVYRPCPGLCMSGNSAIKAYLRQPSLPPRGGAPLRSTLAKELFGQQTVYSMLTPDQKRSIEELEAS